MMNLCDLLSILTEAEPTLRIDHLLDQKVSKITTNSEEAAPHVVFIAIRGTQFDAHTHLREAATKGCALLIGEVSPNEADIPLDRYLQVKDSRLALGLLASQIEGNPSREMLVLGVTGTSGKTTTSYLLESILHAAGKKVGLIGTVSYRMDGKEIPSSHTTPGPIELHRLLRLMRTQGCDALVMEVSSHALKQHRTAGVAFDGALFTNLTAEHLDYHPDLEDYFLAKRMLFVSQSLRSKKWGKNPVFSVHAGNPFGDRLVRDLSKMDVRAFSVDEKTRIDSTGIHGVFSGIEIDSKLIGRFNAENIAGAVSLSSVLPKEFKISDEAIKKGIQTVARVPGRLDQVQDVKGGRVILVDYAHKPDALEKVLEVLRPMRAPGAKLICIVGCGGDRDRTKRPIMGEIACRLSDEVILTSDNPRTEKPENILEEIEKGCTRFKNWKRITDRRSAIESAVKKAKRGDIILIAGKGHEDYQIIGTQKTHFDDREIAEKAL